MKRLLATILSLAVCLSFAATGTAEAAKTKTLRIAHGASEAYHMHRALVVFKQEAEKSGMFTVQLYPSSQFGNDTEMIESVKTGDLTMCVSPSSFLTDEVPSMALIELPYIFPSREAAIATLDGPWGKKQLGLLGKAGLVGLGYYENGMRHVTNSKREIKLPDDLKGLKMRTMQVPAHVEYWNSVGCSAEGSPFPELYTNLSTKVFDGQENPIAHIVAQKFNEVQPFLSLTGHVYTTYVQLMTDEFWDSLSKEEQEVLQKAYAVAYKFQMDTIDKEESQQLKDIAASTAYPCKVTELTSAEKQAFIDSAQPTLKKYRERLGAEVYDEMTAAVAAAAK